MPGIVDASTGLMCRRSPICLRAYRDIPVPTWRIVFPDKLLQFRPLDGLRSDLFSAAGALAALLACRQDICGQQHESRDEPGLSYTVLTLLPNQSV